MDGTLLETTAGYLDSDLSDFELLAAHDGQNTYKFNDVQNGSLECPLWNNHNGHHNGHHAHSVVHAWSHNGQPIYKLNGGQDAYKLNGRENVYMETGQNLYRLNNGASLGVHPNFYRNDRSYKNGDTTYAKNAYDTSPRFGREGTDLDYFTTSQNTRKAHPVHNDHHNDHLDHSVYGKESLDQRSGSYEKNGLAGIYKKVYDTPKGSDTEVSVENIGYEEYGGDKNLSTTVYEERKSGFKWWCDEQNVDYSELTSDSTPAECDAAPYVDYQEWSQDNEMTDQTANVHGSEVATDKLVGNKDSSRSMERTNSGSLSTNDSLSMQFSMDTQYGDFSQESVPIDVASSVDTCSESKDSVLSHYNVSAAAPNGHTGADVESNWKSFIMPSNQVDELRSLILSRLGVKKVTMERNLGRTLERETLETFDASTNTMETNLTFDALEQEITWLRALNTSLKDKLLYIIKNNDRLQYDVNQQYVESVQQHLVRVHEHIDRLVSSSAGSGNHPTDGPSQGVIEDTKESSEPLKDAQGTKEEHVENGSAQDSSNSSTPRDSARDLDVEEIMAENAKIREQNEELRRRLEDLGRKYDESIKRERSLADRLMKAEVSKNTLQEEFNKSVAYLRSTKEKLKNLADSKKRQSAKSTPQNTSDVQPDPAPVYNKAENLEATCAPPMVRYNMATARPQYVNAVPQVQPMRSNTAVPKVKFAEESDIYFLPQRSASECGPIIVKPEKRSRFSQIFNFMDGFFNKQGKNNFTPNEQIALYKAHLMNRGVA